MSILSSGPDLLGPLSFASNRLLREKWHPSQLDALAQELYAIFQTPITSSNGQQTWDQPSPTAPSQFYNQWPNATAPAIQITKGPNTLQISGDGITQDGEPLTGTPTLAAVTGDNSPVPTVLLGSIASGSGQSYQVQIWGTDPATKPFSMTVSATARTMDASATLAPGTDVLAIGYPSGPVDPITKLVPMDWFLVPALWL